MTKGDLRVAFFMGLKSTLPVTAGQMWEYFWFRLYVAV